MNRELEAYLSDVKKHLQTLPGPEQENVLSEMRAHLLEDITRRQNAEPTLSEAEATLRATHAFGRPEEVGVDYVMQRNPPNVAMPSSAPKRRRRLLIGGAIGIALLLVVSFVVANIIGSGGTYEDDTTVYNKDIDYHYAHSGRENVTVQVDPDADSVHIYIDVNQNASASAQSCLVLQVFNPRNVKVFDTTGSCGSIDTHLRFTTTGLWRIVYDYTEFTGTTRVEIDETKTVGY